MTELEALEQRVQLLEAMLTFLERRVTDLLDIFRGCACFGTSD